ncbi:MAG: BatA and WFA domain-containing protein [Planctomycetota bacterium]
MTFGNPLFLWAFVSLIPLIAIYLLKVRPKRKPTTAYFLWNDIFQQRRSNSLFQRFRDLLSLLLMALAFAAVVLALAKPEWNQLGKSDFVLIIDNTASMNSSDGIGTRLDSAKRSAKQIVEALDGNQRCSVATLSTKITYLSNLTDNPRELLQAIDSIEPTTLPFRDSALSQFRNEQDSTPQTNPQVSEETESNQPEIPATRIVLISDGRLDATLPDNFELMKVGSSPGNNCGIIACDMQRLPGSQKATLFCQLASSYPETIEAEIAVTMEDTDTLAKLIPVTIQPGTNPPLLFEIENAVAGKWKLELDLDDSLSDDDEAFLVLQPVQQVPIQVDTTNRYFYENSVLAFSGTGGILNLVDSGGAILIRQGTATEDSSAPNSDLLLFRPDGKSVWWDDIGEEIEVALPRAIKSDHPVIRHIDIASIPFVGARLVSAPSAAEILVEAEDGTPLIWRMSNAGSSAVVVNLNPLEANFYFSAWFPILVYSSATHLAGRTESIPATVATGNTSFIPGSKSGQQNELTDPQQNSITVTGNRTPDLNQVGFYELNSPGSRWDTSASLLSRLETMNDNQEIKSSDRPIKKGWSPVGLLTVFAIIILITESLLYQRRKVG